MSTTLSKVQMVVISCLSMTALTSAFNAPSANASPQALITGRGVEYARGIDQKDRFEYRDREEYFNEDNQDNRFGYDRRYEERSVYDYRRRRTCWRLQRSINYLSLVREELRNEGDYSRARAIRAEIKEQKYKYRQYCEQ